MINSIHDEVEVLIYDPEKGHICYRTRKEIQKLPAPIYYVVHSDSLCGRRDYNYKRHDGKGKSVKFTIVSADVSALDMGCTHINISTLLARGLLQHGLSSDDVYCEYITLYLSDAIIDHLSED